MVIGSRARPAEQRERLLAERLEHIEDDLFAVDVCDLGLLVHACGSPCGSSVVEVRVLDPGRATLFEILRSGRVDSRGRALTGGSRPR